MIRIAFLAFVSVRIGECDAFFLFFSAELNVVTESCFHCGCSNDLIGFRLRDAA